MPRLSRVAPELPVSDMAEAIQYYEKKLGFRLVMEMPDYAVVERDDVALHLFHNHAGTSSPVGIHIFTYQLDELEAELQRNGVMLSQPIMQKPWGNRDFRVSDQSGNELKFTEPAG